MTSKYLGNLFSHEFRLLTIVSLFIRDRLSRTLNRELIKRSPKLFKKCQCKRINDYKQVWDNVRQTSCDQEFEYQFLFKKLGHWRYVRMKLCCLDAHFYLWSPTRIANLVFLIYMVIYSIFRIIWCIWIWNCQMRYF